MAGGQDYEVRYTAKKTRKSASAVKKAVKKVGSSRKRIVKALKRSQNTSGTVRVAAFRREVKVDAYVFPVDDAHDGRFQSY